MGSAMVPTTDTRVVLGQEAIKARGIESRNLCQSTIVRSKLVNPYWRSFVTVKL
tara:strand:- start:586 stop:747 length:162 start_codon:yes stop_codon:yes gene_type:complete